MRDRHKHLEIVYVECKRDDWNKNENLLKTHGENLWIVMEKKITPLPLARPITKILLIAIVNNNSNDKKYRKYALDYTIKRLKLYTLVP